MKTLIMFCLVGILMPFNQISATVYTTTSDGNINASIWSPSTPSSPLANGDEIIINHNVTLNIDFTVYGKMTINGGASLDGSNKKLKIGEGGTTGELINNGNLTVKDLNVKGDDSVANATAPSVTNNGSITASKIHIGDNSAAGIMINNVGATVSTSGEFHLDNILTNKGSINVGSKLKNHGGTIQGGGEIVTCEIEFEENTADNGDKRPGSLISQNICCDFTSLQEPDYKIKGSGSAYASLDLLIAGEGSSSDDHFIDDVDYYSCNENALGQLPVELILFKAEENRQHQVLLSWTTASELNNQNFEIQRAQDGQNFRTIGVIQGNGTTTILQEYSFVDKWPTSKAYYRLKQVDYDGNYEFSEILVLEMKTFEATQIDAFPTIAEKEITIRFTTFDTRKSILKIFNSLGVLMYEEEVYSSNIQEFRHLDLSNYQHGIYNISLSDGNRFTTKAFIVMKSY